MTNRIAVGTPVNVSGKYAVHVGCTDLVVLSDRGTGYGVGLKGNDPVKGHNGPEGWLYYSNNEVTAKKESKTVTQFNKGDKVEFIEFYMAGAITGTKATVVHSYGEFTEVQTDDGERYTPYSRRLKLVEEPKPFTFKDIRKGDTIRRTQNFKGGATEVREGIVSKLASWYVGIDGNYILAYDTDDKTEDVTLALLNRPEPEPEPTLLENTKIGDTLVIRYKSGSTKVYTKARHDGECWDTLVIHANGKVGKGARWSNTELEECAASQSAESTDLITK